MKEEKHYGRCFFCLECICGWRGVGWDQVWQQPVCGPCLKRMEFLGTNYYRPLRQSLLDKIAHGEWGPDEARKWYLEQEQREETAKQKARKKATGVKKELLTRVDLSILEAQSDRTLAEWWNALNDWEWPKELPDPEQVNPRALDWPRRRAAMDWIAAKVGRKRECS